LVVEDFSTNTIALIDGGADINCTKQGIFPTIVHVLENNAIAT